MADAKIPDQLPTEVLAYYERQAAHLRALAETTTTHAIKDRLLHEAEENEELARHFAEAPH